MTISKAEGGCCFSTGNKSELALGYATLYGVRTAAFGSHRRAVETEFMRWRCQLIAIRNYSSVDNEKAVGRTCTRTV